MTQSDSDRRAAAAAVAHHARLAGALGTQAMRLRDAAAGGSVTEVIRSRAELVAWLQTELLPHAQAEEQALYPAAARRPGGRVLVEGLLAEHAVLAALVDELEGAGTPIDAAAAARAVNVLFAVHLAKENDLILPLLLASDEVSVAALLHGMHSLLGETAVHR